MISATRYKWLVFIISILLVANLILLYLYVNKSASGVKPREKQENKQQQTYHNRTAGILEKEVGFSKEQLAQYDTLRENHYKSMRPYFDSFRAAKDSFYRLLRLPDVPDSTLAGAAREIGRSQEKIDLRTFKHFQDVRALCKPEQQVKFEAFIQDVIKKMTFSRSRAIAAKPNEDSLKKTLEK